LSKAQTQTPPRSSRRIRWSDNDRYFGPFTYARDRTYRPLAVVLGSGNDDEYPGCRLRISAFGHTVIAPLPPVIRPWRTWIDTSNREWSKGPGSGFWDVHWREYGFSCAEGFLQVFLGRQTHDSTTTQSWNKHLPWTQWRFVRHSLYGLTGEHVWTESDRRDWTGNQAAKDNCPSVGFAFMDFDGEPLTVRCVIEEREWHFGEGSFKWLSWFRPPMIRRSLDLRFSGETGRRKGSWKGGTIGSGIDMLPGELHEAAFRRYCDKRDMTFVGPAEQAA